MKSEIIGFIGLGIMGKPMAMNLIKAGYELVVYNRSESPINELVKLGAEKGSSPEDVAQKSDIIITMLPDSPDVEEVILGKNGVLKGAKKGAIIIDMSSIAPFVSRKIAKEASEYGVEMLDAPVSGGETGAIEGTLAIMVGGKKEIFDRCYNLLKVMGRSVKRVGEIGAGNFTKLANQIIVSLNIVAVSEAFILGTKAGLNPQDIYDVIKDGLAGSRVLETKAPLIFERNFKPGFKIKLQKKDIDNAVLTAKDLKVPVPFTSLIQQVLAALVNQGKDELDHSAIIRFFESLAGFEVKKEGLKFNNDFLKKIK
ncbi:2-hydroxy-3-oxopropionate reductase [candidate division KSB1 bacterium]|nr:MAG: 2-hydroxy-3-oxopropionate reductase [candidate division KSB1 bacterium]